MNTIDQFRSDSDDEHQRSNRCTGLLIRSGILTEVGALGFKAYTSYNTESLWNEPGFENLAPTGMALGVLFAAGGGLVRYIEHRRHVSINRMSPE